MKRAVAIISAIVMLSATHKALAWDSFGHGAIAYVAEQHLSAEAKSEARRYLKHSLPFYASWMDHWRAVPPFHPTNMWHGIKSDEKGKLRWDIQGERANGQAMIQVKRIVEDMRNYKNLPDSVVRQNLIYLIHSVADMHCPVHVQFPKTTFAHYRYTVKRKGKSINMHGFWDAAPAYKRKGWTYEMYAAEVDKISPKQAKKIIKKGDYDYWGRDILKNTHRIYSITTPDKELTKLTSEESAAITALADEMAMKAAHRLAYILNTIFE